MATRDDPAFPHLHQFGVMDGTNEGWQINASDGSFAYKHQEVTVFRRPNSPWIEIQVPDGVIAVWAKSGAVHAVDEQGAVIDPPIVLPGVDTGG